MTPSYMSLETRTALVTGAARGIGNAIAHRLHEAGARVALVDIDKEAVNAAADALGDRALAVQADVSSADSVQAAFDAVLARWECLDILVNNAGIIGGESPIHELSESGWDTVIDTNLKSVFLCCRAAVRHMLRRKQGTIVSMASVAGKEGNPNMAPYSISKAGIICLTKSLAREVVSHGIRVNCVAPALVETTLTSGMDEEQMEYMKSRIPMARFGKPEEIAALVHFLASDEATFTTGQCYDISGGRSTY